MENNGELAIFFAENKEKPAHSCEELHYEKQLLSQEKEKTHWWGSAFDGDLTIEQEILSDLRNCLLDINGTEAAIADSEENFEDIMAFGQLWSNAKIQEVRHKKFDDCNKDVANYYLSNKSKMVHKDTEAFRIAVGYAIDEEGIWKSHSWLVKVNSRGRNIVEVSAPKELYYGFVLTKNQCEKFCKKHQSA